MTEQLKVDPAWNAMIQSCVIEFVMGSEKLYKIGIQKAGAMTAKKTVENETYVRNMFLDGMTGLFVLLLLGSLGNISTETEEAAISILKEKFKDMRTQQFQQKMMGAAP